MSQPPLKLHRPLVQAVVAALREIFQNSKYADRVIQQIFLDNKHWGSRDRSFIAENTYEIVRWWRRDWDWGLGVQDLAKATYGDEELTRLLGAHLLLKGQLLPDWPDFAGLSAEAISRRKTERGGIRAVAQSIPDWLDEIGAAEYGDFWHNELTALNEHASVVLRVNTLKTDRATLHKDLNESECEADETPLAPSALVLRKRGNIFTNLLFKQGCFEVQDAGSQCIAPFVQAEPGMRVVDACAGAGGKTLHLATLMENRGTIIAMDTEAWKLQELSRRARRNGISIIQTRPITSTKVVKRLANSADRVLLDVPCSGLGVLRRNPDAKWKVTPQVVENVRAAQTLILQRYSQMLRPGGRLVYATCSIFRSENEGQVAAFLENNPDFSLLEERKISPAKDGFDGFYMAALERK